MISPEDSKTFKEEIVTILEPRNLYFDWLASRLGVSQGRLTHVLRDVSDLDLPSFELLCHALDVPLDNFTLYREHKSELEENGKKMDILSMRRDEHGQIVPAEYGPRVLLKPLGEPQVTLSDTPESHHLLSVLEKAVQEIEQVDEGDVRDD